MGKASSTKKVQRAARAGGRVSSGQPRSLLFPGVLTLIVVLGVALVVYARNDRLDEDLGGVPQLSDHIHQAFGVNVCGEWELNIPEFQSTIGIHTHGDGVLHIHPHSQLGVGANATVGRFFKNVRDEGGIDVEISDSKLTYLEEDIEEGETECEGVDDPQLLMAYWPDASDAAALPEVVADAGVLVPPGDVDAWATAIGHLLADPAERERLGAAGRARAARYTVAANAAAFVALYRAALTA